ncbi:MAG: WbqC family protein [Candidatus Pacearchaeota archaeon]
MSKVMSAHQPNFMPYLGVFDKMKKSDIFVIRDEVLYVRKEFQNRNKIRINGNDNLNNPQSKWVGVPVCHKEDYIKHILINNELKIKGKNWKHQLIHDLEANYKKTEYFNKFFPMLKEIILKEHTTLLNLNLEIMEFFRKAFNINTKIIFASQLGLKPEHYEKSNASQDIIKICKTTGANVYLSGEGGKNYLDLELFNKEGIKVEFQEYIHPVYNQAFSGFLPYMSAIDALFNYGGMPEPKNILEVIN